MVNHDWQFETERSLVESHGLKFDEFERIVEGLGREPNLTELGIFSAMWNEHCSYKSSKYWLKQLPTTGDRVVQGPGENAGVIDIDDGDVAVFKMESHNHPSFLEPYQGAAAGAVAKTVLKKMIGSKFNVIGAVTQLGLMSCDKLNWKNSEIRKNPFFCPDKKSVKLWEKYLLAVRKAGSSCGAIIELRATGVPVGLGAPIYSKLDTDIAAALMSINAVKGVNIGAGMNAAFLTGEENSDEMRKGSGAVKFKTNQAGGILGGISSGQNIIASFAVKPTSSILTKRNTIDKKGKNTKISVKGRHDPCVGIRAVPIGEAMINCVLLDHYLMHRAQCY